jgi:hypothetical protein
MDLVHCLALSPRVGAKELLVSGSLTLESYYGQLGGGTPSAIARQAFSVTCANVLVAKASHMPSPESIWENGSQGHGGVICHNSWPLPNNRPHISSQ